MIGKVSSSVENQSLSLIRYVVTFLIGSGGTGAAIALVGKEGFQYFGLITLGICLAVAIILIVTFIKLDVGILEKSRSDGLNSLNKLYIDSLQTTGTILAAGNIPDKRKMLISLAQELKTLADIQKRVERDLLIEFLDGIKEVTKHWEKLAIRKGSDDENPTQKD